MSTIKKVTAPKKKAEPKKEKAPLKRAKKEYVPQFTKKPFKGLSKTFVKLMHKYHVTDPDAYRKIRKANKKFRKALGKKKR